jgi:outer membrane protein assembly factor BamB
MVALDKKTGSTVWTSKGVSDWAAHGSPIALDFQGRRLIVTLSARSMICVDAADGRLLWRYDRPSVANLASKHGESLGGHNTSTPLHLDGMLVALNINCSGGAVRLMEEDGAITARQIWDTHAPWPKVSGYIAHEGYLYTCSLPGNGAAWTCVDLKTGRPMFYTPAKALGGPILYADGCFYCLPFRSTKTVCLLEATPTGMKQTGQFELGDSVSYPALADGRFYVRCWRKYLYVYDVRDRDAWGEVRRSPGPRLVPTAAAGQ